MADMIRASFSLSDFLEEAMISSGEAVFTAGVPPQPANNMTARKKNATLAILFFISRKKLLQDIFYGAEGLATLLPLPLKASNDMTPAVATKTPPIIQAVRFPPEGPEVPDDSPFLLPSSDLSGERAWVL